MIQPSEARELCSKSEWELVENSFAPVVETIPRSGLKSRIHRIRKLHRKTTDLVSLQHSDSRKRTTRRKTELFAEALARYEATLNAMEITHPASKDIDHNKFAKFAKGRRSLDMDALQERADREPERRKRQLLPALALRGEQQAQKSGATHIQSHVGSVTRRKQTIRDMKNR
jgi:hypothetical protein